MIEAAHAYEWLLQALQDPTIAAAGSLGVYPDLAPADGPFPRVVFGLQSPGSDAKDSQQYRLLTNPLFFVRAVGYASQFLTCMAIADAVDTLIDRASGTGPDGVTIRMATREQPIILTQMVDNVTWKIVGGLYRLYI